MAFVVRRWLCDAVRKRRAMLSASDEVLLNSFRLALLRCRGTGEPGKTAVTLESLQGALNTDALSELVRKRSTLVEALQQCPKWFALDGHTIALTDAALALGAVPFATPPVDDKSAAAFSGRQASTGSNTVVKFAAVGQPAVHVDVSTPILTADEVDRMSPSLMVATTMVPYRRNSALPVRHLEACHHQGDSGAAAGRFPSIPELEEFDALYQKKGFIAPSEMLNALCEYIPTFYVEVSQLLLALPQALRDQVCDGLPKNKDGRYMFVVRPFANYPILFQLHQSRFQRSLIRLNMDMPYVRSHPNCGMANRAMRKFSQEFSQKLGVVSRDHLRLQYVSKQPGIITGSLTSGHADAPTESIGHCDDESVPRHLRLKALPIDAQIVLILLAHLPRQLPHQDPSSVAAFLPLVPWIAAFPQEHLDVLNKVPQERVLTIMARHRRIFQISTVDGSDRNLFFPWSIDMMMEERPALRVDDAIAVDSTAPHEAQLAVDAEDAAEAVEERATQQVAEDDDPVGTQSRVSSFKVAIADDLIGVEELTSDTLQETFDRGDDVDDSDDATTDDKDVPAAVRDEAPVHDRRSDHGGGGADHESYYVPTGAFGALCIRRLPPNVAPGSLSDLDFSTTPDAPLLEHVLGFLHPPPGPLERSCLWRWVAIEGMYQAIPSAERQRLKRFRGLPNFLRLHGRVFEVSSDARYVIALDPSGRVPPLIPTQRQFTFEERMVLPSTFDETADPEEAAWRFLKDGDDMRVKYKRVLGDAQIPTSRAQLKLLDPDNPLLDKSVLADEVAGFLPDHPVTMMQLMMRLPPVMRAALPSTSLLRVLVKISSKLKVWTDEGSKRLLVARTDVAEEFTAMRAPQGNASSGTWSLARVLRTIERHAEGAGCSVGRISKALPKEAHAAMQRELGVISVLQAVETFPERFEIVELDGRKMIRIPHGGVVVEDRRGAARV